MLVKVLMCNCYTQQFHDEGNEYVKKLCRFSCYCEDDHLVYILSCKEHPSVSPTVSSMDSHCRCPNIGSQEICDFCRQVRYLLNFKVYKFCLKKIPVNFQDHMVLTTEYFKSMPSCQPFFKYCDKIKRVCIFLNNPNEKYMSN